MMKNNTLAAVFNKCVIAIKEKKYVDAAEIIEQISGYKLDKNAMMLFLKLKKIVRDNLNDEKKDLYKNKTENYNKIKIIKIEEIKKAKEDLLQQDKNVIDWMEKIDFKSKYISEYPLKHSKLPIQTHPAEPLAADDGFHELLIDDNKKLYRNIGDKIIIKKKSLSSKEIVVWLSKNIDFNNIEIVNARGEKIEFIGKKEKDVTSIIIKNDEYSNYYEIIIKNNKQNNEKYYGAKEV